MAKSIGPKPRNSNPGVGVEARVAFSNSERSWTEDVNFVHVAAATLRERGYTVNVHDGWLEHPESEYVLLPQLVEMQPLEDSGVRTVTTIQVHHPRLCPDGVFEYQHSTGEDLEGSAARGFDQWAQVDFVTLLESLRDKPADCTALEMSFPEKAGKPARTRRAVLGPVMHYMSQPPDKNPGDDEHPFCPCCLLTHSFAAFKELMEGSDFNCLRLFAARDEEGVSHADCRVNGDDFEPGMAALREYAATWAPAGYEFRKQYVILQTVAKPLVATE